MLHFAIIGCGRIANRHAENISRVGKLAAVCDTNAERAWMFANKYKALAFNSISELIQSEIKIDVVVICTPNGYHAEQCIQALNNGKHVLCEKPLCITTSDAWNIIEAEKRSGKKLFVVKSMRFNPYMQALKKLIDNGELGSIYSFQLNCFWNRPKEYYKDWHGKILLDGGTLYTQFSHYIDAMLWLFGDLEKAVGYTTNTVHDNLMEFEDTGVASLQFKGGIIGGLNWSVNTFEKNLEIALTVIAERGTIALGGEYLNEVKYQKLASDFCFRNIKNIKNRNELSHHKEVYDNLVIALQDGNHSYINALDGLKTVEAIEKIYKSLSFLYL